MRDCDCGSDIRKYAIVVALGAVGGGLLVALATKAIPRMMPKMMRNMMAQMGGEGCSPAEM